MLKPRTGVRFCKNNVNTKKTYSVFVKQLIDQVSEHIPAPWPATYLGQAFFINIYDDDATIQSPRHEGPEPRVINEVVQPVKRTEFKRT